MNTVQPHMTHIPTPHPGRRRRRQAFTLVELMVSIAMVVLLLVGIHQVFRMSSNTIGTGQAVNAVNREVRAAQTVMQEDFRRSLKDSPLFVIHSGPVAAAVRPEDGDADPIPKLGPEPFFHFNTLAERDRDIDGNPATIDRDGDGTEETTYTRAQLAHVNDRIHRSDIVGFFARGLFSRQTADDGLFVSNTKAFDAWVWYGHVKLPDPAAAGYFDPGVLPAGVADGPNRFAANWVLGRRAILLKDSRFLNNVPESYVDTVGNPYFGPLAYNSQSTVPPRASGATLEVRPAAGANASTKKVSWLRDSRLDIAGITVEAYRAELRSLLASSSLPPAWCNPLIFRYECDPKVRRPINSSNLAKTTPYFVGNVSQFLVEFAGDFITQNNDINDPGCGLVTDTVPDGVIDFVMLAPNVLDQTNPPAYPANPRVRKTRWYGLPRDSNGDGRITAVKTTGALANAMPDVVPVWDVIRSGFPRAPKPAFELWNPNGDPNGGGKIRYVDNRDYTTLTTAHHEFRYVCAWTDSAPAMLRIVMKLEDPAGRLADGQWVEFVLDSP